MRSCSPWPTASAHGCSASPPELDVAVRELDEYFTGQRDRFDLPLDWRLSAGFAGPS